MIDVKVKGGSKWQRSMSKSMVEFAAHYLMSGRLANTLTVKVKIIDDLWQKDHCHADCIYVDSDYRPKEFLIRVDGGMMERPFLETIAHEMVHIKQYARDEMRELYDGRHRFLGSYYDSDLNYWEQPWEIEAHGRERGLFEMWVDENKLHKKKWTLEKLYA